MAVRTSSTRGVHAHGCVTCNARYEDACDQPQANSQCSICNGGTGWQLLIAGRLPRDCCRAHTRPATKDDLKLYRLSTACPWFRCPVCSRTFPFRSPVKENA